MTTNIQLLRSSIANKRPAPATLLEGQAAVNLNSSEPGLYFKLSSGVLTKIGPACVNSNGTAPNGSPAGSAGNAVGEQWFDGRTTLTAPVMKVYDGSIWRTTSGFTIDDANGNYSLNNQVTVRNLISNGTGANSYVQLNAGPTTDEASITAATGMVRYDSTVNEYKGYYGGTDNEWKIIGGSAGGASVTIGDIAPTTPPPVAGDLWWDSRDGRLFVYYTDANTSQWVDASPNSAGVTNIKVLDDISASFDGVQTVFQMASGGGAVAASNAQQCLIQLGGVMQRPGTDYSINGANLTFTTAPQNSSVTFAGRVLGSAYTLASGADLGACATTTSNGVWCWNSALLPGQNGQYDIGSTGAKARNLYLSGTSTVDGNSNVGGALAVTAGATVGTTLGVTGNTTVGGTLGVTGNTTIGGTNIQLNADGTSTFSDDLIVGDTSTGVQVSPNFTGTAANNACEIRFRSVNNPATGVVGLNRSSQGDGLTFSMTTTGALQIGGNSNTYISGTVSTTSASGPDFARLQSDGTNYGLRLYRSSSLRAHKTDIQDLSNAVTLTKALRPVSFKSSIESDLEAPHGGDFQVGFIAEEVEAVHTGLCTYGDGNLSGVCYDRMSAIAIAALQEALTRIEDLEARLDAAGA
jgi:hypothetical protein